MKANSILWIILLAVLAIAVSIIPALALAAGVPCQRCGAIDESGGTFCGQCGAMLPQKSQPSPNLSAPSQKTETIPLGSLDPSVHLLISQLSDQDLRRIVAVMLERIEARQERFAPDPNSVASMSRKELEDLLQKYSGTKPIAPKTSAFLGFLQFVGGTVLFILAITIIVSL